MALLASKKASKKGVEAHSGLENDLINRENGTPDLGKGLKKAGRNQYQIEKGAGEQWMGSRRLN